MRTVIRTSLQQNTNQTMQIYHNNIMNQDNQPQLSQNKPFASYPTMVALMAVLQTLTVLFGHKMFLFFGFHISAGWIFLMPILIYIFQIVAECYGWQFARQMVWINFLVNLILVIIFSLFSLIPMSNFDHYDIEHAYQVVLLYQTPATITMLSSMFLSDLVVSILMCWSKFYTNGKYLFMRIAFLHCIAELLMLSGGFVTGTIAGFSLLQIWNFSLDSFLMRSIIMLILLPIIKLIIWLIKYKIEKMVSFDLQHQFNPFKFNIDYTKFVQYNLSGYNTSKLKNIELKEIIKDYNDINQNKTN